MKHRVNQTGSFQVEAIESRAEAENGTHITLALSSETPVRRDYGDEILLHGPENIDMSRALPNGLPLLVSHDDRQLPIGRLKNIRIEGKRLRGDAFFSGRPEAQAVRQDVLDGIVTDVSVGYKILDYKVAKAERADEVAKVFITRWMPREGSMVASGADNSVGVGRAEDGELEMDLDMERGISEPVLDAESQSAEGDPATIITPPAEVQAEAEQEEAASVPEMEAAAEAEAEACATCEKPAAESSCEKSEPAPAAVDARADEAPEVEPVVADDDENRALPELLNEERSALRTVAMNLQFRSEAEVDQILSTRDLDAARAILLKPQTITTGKESTMSFNEALMQGLSQAVRGEFANLDESVKGAITQTGARSFKADLFNTVGTRSNEMNTSGNGGANTIYEQNIGFLELLRARTAVLKAGGRTRQGIGNLSYMRQKAASSAALRAELGSVSNSFADFEKVHYTPKALTAKIILTDELQKESLLDLQNALRNDIVKQFAIAMDAYALNGATGAVAISGLLSSGSGIYAGDLASAAAPTFKAVNSLKSLVDQTAVDLAACAYITTPGLMGVLETTSKFAGGIGLPIADQNKINGYNAFTSTNVPVSGDDHTLVFGDFTQLELCLQGPTEFDVNTTTYFAEGLTVLSARQYFDVGILHPKAFAACKNFLVA